MAEPANLALHGGEEVSVTLAGAPDVPVIMALLNDAAAWLESRDSDQWHGGFGARRVGRIVARGGTYIAWRDGGAAATITASPAGDPVLWEPAELAEPATYISKMVTARRHAGEGLGADLLTWAVNAAHERGDRWVRLDAWRTQAGLHAYYERQGFAHVRTVTAPGRNSGALFQRLALPVAHPFARAAALPARHPARAAGILAAGTAVVTRDWQQGVISEVTGPDADRPVVSAEWEYGNGHGPVFYRVRLEDGREIVVLEGDVTEAATVKAAAHV